MAHRHFTLVGDELVYGPWIDSESWLRMRQHEKDDTA